MLRLTSPMTLIISPSGSDTSGDGSAANPFRNPQAAIDYLVDGVDMCGHDVDIQLETAPGSANFAVDPNTGVGNWTMAPGSEQYFYDGIRMTGKVRGQGSSMRRMLATPGRFFEFGRQGGRLRITSSNPSYPLGAFLSPSDKQGINIAEGASLVADGFSLDTGVAGQDCIEIQSGSTFAFENLALCMAGSPSGWTDCCHICVGFGSRLFITGGYYASGFAMYHINVGGCSQVYFDTNGMVNIPVNFVGNPTYTLGYICCDGSWAFMPTVQFNGTFNGPAGLICRRGVIDTNGAKNIPGSMQYSNGGGTYY